jgi:hypothetical protein
MPTYNAIATTTLSSAVSTVTFSSISQDYTDLVLVYKMRMATGGAVNTFMRINGDSGNNYNFAGTYYTLGVAQGSHTTNAGNAAWLDNVDSSWTTITHIDFNNYKSTSMKKGWLVFSGAPASQVDMKWGSWNSTAAINQIQIYNPSSVNFAVGSQFTLYGILAA